MGVSVEDSRVIDRVRLLSQTPARVKFLSCEPLIGPLDELPLNNINWVIVGGESGKGARPMKEEWVQSIQQQCRDVHRSEGHTSELQSLMRISYAVFCLKKTTISD